MNWASQNLSEDSIKSFDNLVNTGDPGSIQLAVDGLLSKYQNENGKNLYEFWGDSLSETICRELDKHKDKVVINCASNEYFKSIDNKALGVSVITPEFKEIKNGKTRMISFFAKKARGMMARFIVENRIDFSEQILDFNMAGYKFDQSLSSQGKPVFTRIKP